MRGFCATSRGAPRTKYWTAGDAPNKDTPVGTWVATFDSNGNFKGHVGSFESMDNRGNVKLIDQFNNRGYVDEQTYRNKGGAPNIYISNDASNYRIMLWDDNKK